MPAPPPPITEAVADRLALLGEKIRAQRKALKVNATAAAQAAGMSRVTLHRIERGEPSVTIGAYLNVLAVLGQDFEILTPAAATEREKTYRQGWIPARIRLDEYPQLKQLAWQVHADTLTPAEALSIYTRNKRHIDERAMDERERELVKALHLALDKPDGPNV
jgi:transcriptional regulator with XRE-family HTH domain